jgi:hypothetical protein
MFNISVGVIPNYSILSIINGLIPFARPEPMDGFRVTMDGYFRKRYSLFLFVRTVVRSTVEGLPDPDIHLRFLKISLPSFSSPFHTSPALPPPTR